MYQVTSQKFTGTTHTRDMLDILLYELKHAGQVAASKGADEGAALKVLHATLTLQPVYTYITASTR